MSETGIFLLCMFCLFVGWLISFLILYKTCDGNLVLYEHQMYLSLTEKDAEKIKHASFCCLRIKRKNFSGFNEGGV